MNKMTTEIREYHSLLKIIFQVYLTSFYDITLCLIVRIQNVLHATAWWKCTPLLYATVSFVISVRLSASMEQTPLSRRIFIKSDIWTFSKISQENSSFIKIWQEEWGTLQENVCTFMIISRWVLLRMRNVSEESCSENEKKKIV
jgi:hypothetical protein